MARVSSQKVRQAVLVGGDPLNPNELPEKLQLFNELGEPIVLGGGGSRREYVLSTEELGVSESESAELPLFPSVRMFRIETNRPARVRIYPTEAQRNADMPRGIGVKPFGNHGRLLEVVTDVGLLDLTLSPVVDMTSVDETDERFYIHVTNLDDAVGEVDVTFYYFRTE